jgi:hypothetical protein
MFDLMRKSETHQLLELARVLVRFDHVAHSILKNLFMPSSCVRHLRRPSHMLRTGYLFATLFPDHLAAVI